MCIGQDPAILQSMPIDDIESGFDRLPISSISKHKHLISREIYFLIICYISQATFYSVLNFLVEPM